ncbi:MAG: cobalamin-dependent protein [Thermodesulfobacteriota bacterium]|nr:cobalamin-dependent protein [Thermodesulfobacteriota bacterium]
MDAHLNEPLTVFRRAFLDFNIDVIADVTDKMLAVGISTRQFLDTCTPLMGQIGEKFEKGEYFLPQLVMAGEMFKTASTRIKSAMPDDASGDPIAEIVLGTPRGDIHDLGKDIFAVLAEASGFAVHNLGVDVPPATFIERLSETGASILGLSSLLTTTFEAIEEIIRLLEQKGMRNNIHVILGGGATEQSLVEKLGVDSQTRDAYEGLNILKALTGDQAKGAVA